MHNDEKRYHKNRKNQRSWSKNRRRSIGVIGGLISIKRDGNNKNKIGKMRKNHGNGMSQVRRNKNNKLLKVDSRGRPELNVRSWVRGGQRIIGGG